MLPLFLVLEQAILSWCEKFWATSDFRVMRCKYWDDAELSLVQTAAGITSIAFKFKAFWLPMSLIPDQAYELIFFAQHRVSLHSQPKSVLNTSPGNPKPWNPTSPYTPKKGLISNSFRSFKTLFGVFQSSAFNSCIFLACCTYIVSNLLLIKTRLWPT